MFLALATPVWAAYCPECGVRQPRNAKFCYKCGARLPDTAAVKRGQDAAAVVEALGTLKVGSRPENCVVTFRGNRFQKDQAVLTLRAIPPGDYDVIFFANGQTLIKTVTIESGQTASVFADLAPATPAPAPATTLMPETAAPNPPPPPVSDADDAFNHAETLRQALNPLQRKSRYEEARRLYLKLIERWPDCDKVEASHYRLGEIYESVFYRNFDQAIAEYRAVLDKNFQTKFPVRWRIATIYANLNQRSPAREWYELAAQYEASTDLRRQAQSKAEALRAAGN